MGISFGPLDEVRTDGEARGVLPMRGLAFGQDFEITNEHAVAIGRFLLFGFGEGEVFDDYVVPPTPVTGDGTFYFTGSASGYVRVVGQASHTSFRVEGAAFGAGLNAASGRFRLFGGGAEVAPVTQYGFAVEQEPVVASYGNMDFTFDRETIASSTAHNDLPIHVLRERARIAGSGRASLDALIALAEAIALDSRAAFVLFALAEDEVVLSSPATYDYTALARVVERMLASGAATNYLDALQLVAEAIVLRTMAGPLAFEQVLDTAVINALVADAFTAAAQVVERLLAGDVAVSSHHMTVVVRETMLADTSAATTAELSQLVRESVGFAVHMALDTGEYVAWVLNTDGKGVSTYQNYPFNSFMKLGGKYYGAMSDGLYLLEGENDAGADIAARIRLGVTDMNTRKLKRVPEAYIGYKSDGNLLLRVIVTDDRSGDKVALEYLMRPRPAVALRESRFEPGRGINVVDWDFEIENINGADFDLAEVEFHPLITARRTRG